LPSDQLAAHRVHADPAGRIGHRGEERRDLAFARALELVERQRAVLAATPGEKDSLLHDNRCLAANAAIARRLLAGERGAARDIVLLNAAASLLIAERVGTIREGIAAAGDALDQGKAAAILEKLVALSNEPAEAAAS